MQQLLDFNVLLCVFHQKDARNILIQQSSNNMIVVTEFIFTLVLVACQHASAQAAKGELLPACMANFSDSNCRRGVPIARTLRTQCSHL